MKQWFMFSCLAITPVLLSGCGQQIRLFNGKNLDGWKPVLSDEMVHPASVWSAKDGKIRCEGKPNGYIRTARPYANYKLHLEWRWTEQPTNSGVLLHMNGPDQVWPTCIEAQLRSGDAGDIILIGEELSIVTNGLKQQPQDSRYLRIGKIHPSNEKNPGQWNSYDILCKDGTIELRVNGLLQNSGTNASVSSGYICLQSEGSPIEFRNIILQPLP